jgi:hypothetical protein
VEHQSLPTSRARVSWQHLEAGCTVPHVVKHLSNYSHVSFTAQDSDILTPGGLFLALHSEVRPTLFDPKVWETLLSTGEHARLEGPEATTRD